VEVETMFQQVAVLIEQARKAGSTREPGQTNVEYALILFLVAGATAIAFSIVGQNIQSALDCVNSAFAGRC
jgi:Flp pilus assembly pilin Flp